MREFDCAQLFEGDAGAYSHEYDRYLDFFKMLSYSETEIVCSHAPRSWGPLIQYLGHSTIDSIIKWSIDRLVTWPDTPFRDPRHVVEVSSTCRPELVHALFLIDTEWPNLRSAHLTKRSFYVTCNGSLYRPEIATYRTFLHDHQPNKRKAILVPCAAQKPYPAPLHEAVIEVLGNLRDEWEIIIATGVLGLVPEALWERMPLYDSGLPYQHRVTTTVEWYFTKHQYDRVLVYSDFYAQAISRGLAETGPHDVEYIFGTHYRTSDSNLMLEEHLMTLESLIRA